MSKTKHAPAGEVMEVEAEPIHHVRIRTVEQAVKPDLIVFNKYEARCKELTELYGGITIKGLEDKEGYAKAKEAVRELRTMRTGTEGDRKSAKSFYLECGRVIDKKAELIENVLVALEAPIKKQIKDIDDENDRLRVERIEKEKERLRGRVALLGTYGAISDGVDIKLDELVYSNEVIREMDEEYFHEKVVPQFKEIFAAKELIREANEKAIREENERQEQQRKEFERQQQLLKEQQAEIDRQNKELEKKRFAALVERTKRRVAELEKIGFIYDFQKNAFNLHDKIIVHQGVYQDSPDEEWDEFMRTNHHNIESAKKIFLQEQDQQQKQRDEQIRLKVIEDQKEKDRLESIKKQEEYERSTDKQKYLNFVQELNGVEFPILVSKHFKAKLNIIREKLEEINSL